MTPGISAILKIEIGTGDNVLESSDWMQKDNADIVERDDLYISFFVAKVLFIHCSYTMMLKMF